MFQRIHLCLLFQGWGGAERVMATLANEFSKKGNEVVIITLVSEDSFYKLDDNVSIISAFYNINKTNKLKRNVDIIINGIKSIFFLRKLIKKIEPDVIISFLTHTNILLLILKLLNKNINLVVSERNDPNERNLITRITTKYFYPTADIVVCQSKSAAEFFPKNKKEKIKIIPNPVNSSSISNEIFDERKKVIVGVGRLFDQKNFSLLIDSFNSIKNEFPEHTLEIYGEGHLRYKLQNQINRLNLSKRVFLKGARKNVMKHISDSELYVMSSNYEGFPNALVEAMASGLPVVSTDFPTGVARELVKETNGIVVPVRDRQSLSVAIKTIISDPSIQKKMAIENKKIGEKFSVNKIICEWDKVFSFIIDS